VSLDHSWLLVGSGSLLRVPQLLDETHWLSLQSSLEPSPGSGVDELDEVLIAQVEELVELDTPVLVLLEGSGSLFGGSLFLGGEISLEGKSRQHTALVWCPPEIDNIVPLFQPSVLPERPLSVLP
jgi:hypothetical protein